MKLSMSGTARLMSLPRAYSCPTDTPLLQASWQRFSSAPMKRFASLCRNQWYHTTPCHDQQFSAPSHTSMPPHTQRVCKQHQADTLSPKITCLPPFLPPVFLQSAMPASSGLPSNRLKLMRSIASSASASVTSWHPHYLSVSPDCSAASLNVQVLSARM